MAGKLGTIYVSIAARMGAFRRDLKVARAESLRTSQFMAKNFDAVKGAMIGLAGVAGIGMVAKSIIRMGMEFQQSMAVVRGVTRATEKEFVGLQNIAKKLGETTEWTASQAADALKFLGMAGFSASKAMAALPGTLDLATAGNIALGQAADIATNALTAMQLEVGELGRVNDVFVGTITRSNTNMEMMAESFRYAAPVAKAYGISIERLSALIGTLGNAGIQGSMAGTQLAFGFQKAARVFKELGIDGTGKDMVDALEAANKAGWDSAKMMQVFGMRGGRAALVLRNLIPQVREFEATLEGSKGEAKKLADVMRGTVSFAFKELKSALEGIAIEAFTQKQSDLGKAIKGVTEAIRANKEGLVGLATGIVKFVADAGRLVSWLSRVNEESKKFTKWMGDFQEMGGRMASQDKGLIDLVQALARLQTEGMPSSDDAKERLADLRASLSVIEFQLSVAKGLLSVTGKSVEAEAKINDLNKKKKTILDGIAEAQKDANNQTLLAKIHTTEWGNSLDETAKKLQGIIKVNPEEMAGNLKNAFQQERLWEQLTVTPKVDLALEDFYKDVDKIENTLQSLIKKTPIIEPVPIEVLLEAQKLKNDFDNLKKEIESKPFVITPKMQVGIGGIFGDEWSQGVIDEQVIAESVDKAKEALKKLEEEQVRVPVDIALDDFFKDIDAAEDALSESTNYMFLLSERTANAMEQNFSNLFFDIMQGELKSFEDYMVAIFNSISRAFSDILGQMLADWIKTQLAMKSVAASGSGFGSFFGAVMSMFGGGAAAAGGRAAYTLPMGSASGLAEGGPVSAGTPYIVGEKGPELFMPSSAGTIIPNIDRPNIFGLESKGGGEVNNNYSISIHAVDAASFAELVERNPEVIVSQVTGAADSGHGGLRQSMRDIIR